MSTYTPPTFDALRGKLLKDEVVAVKQAIEPVKEKWVKYGVSLVADGWSDVRSHSLEGILAYCRGSALYIHSIECGVQQKTAPILM